MLTGLNHCRGLRAGRRHDPGKGILEIGRPTLGLGSSGQEKEVGLGSGNMPDPNRVPWTMQNSLGHLAYVWFCTTLRGGMEPNRPIGAAASLPREK